MSAVHGRRILGMDDNGPIYDPYPNNSHLVLGASGSAKTTSVNVTTIESCLSDAQTGLIINDVKEGEVASQIDEMCLKYGRKFGAIDDFHIMGPNYPYRIDLNPFGSVVSTYRDNKQHLLFAIENVTQILIEEPKGGEDKNKWFRDCPREEIALGIRILLERNVRFATPGALYCLMSDPVLWRKARTTTIDEGEPATRSRAMQSLDLQDNNPEQYYQHIRAALSALQIYEPGSALHEVGQSTSMTAEQLLDEAWIACLVQPSRYAQRVGSHTALTMEAVANALMTSTDRSALFVLDEVCNSPFQSAVQRVTIVRSYNGRYIYIAQSRLDLEQKYGVKPAAVLEENCPVVQYLSFSRYEDAERVAKAWGQEWVVNQTLNVSADRSDLSGTFSATKHNRCSADELMNMPPNKQVLRVQGVGHILCDKFYQNQAAPFCYDLAPNPQEGGRVLLADPIVTFDPTLRDRDGSPIQ